MLTRAALCLLITLPLGAGCSLYFESEPSGGPATPPPDAGVPPRPNPTPDASPPPDPANCQMRTLDSRVPGFPFNVARFQERIYGDLYEGCGFSGCHDAETTPFGYRVWRTDPLGCADIRTFNELFDWVNLSENPRNSELLVNINGTNPFHPIQLSSDDPTLEELTEYILEAYNTLNSDIGLDPIEQLDYDIFAGAIQPLMDQAQCTLSGCHNDTDSIARPFDLSPSPPSNSPEMDRNFLLTAEMVDIDDPESSYFYIRATDRHRSVAFPEPELLLEWIRIAQPGAN